MSNIKLVRNLTIKESENVCKSANGCAECPLLISSYHKEIHCMMDDKIKMYEVEEVHKILNSNIDLDTNKIVNVKEDKQ